MQTRRREKGKGVIEINVIRLPSTVCVWPFRKGDRKTNTYFIIKPSSAPFPLLKRLLMFPQGGEKQLRCEQSIKQINPWQISPGLPSEQSRLFRTTSALFCIRPGSRRSPGPRETRDKSCQGPQVAQSIRHTATLISALDKMAWLRGDDGPLLLLVTQRETACRPGPLNDDSYNVGR